MRQRTNRSTVGRSLPYVATEKQRSALTRPRERLRQVLACRQALSCRQTRYVKAGATTGSERYADAGNSCDLPIARHELLATNWAAFST